MHGSVKHKLAWSQPVDSVPFDPVLVLLAEVSYRCAFIHKTDCWNFLRHITFNMC